MAEAPEVAADLEQLITRLIQTAGLRDYPDREAAQHDRSLVSACQRASGRVRRCLSQRARWCAHCASLGPVGGLNRPGSGGGATP
jgi:hypothetical protein